MFSQSVVRQITPNW